MFAFEVAATAYRFVFDNLVTFFWVSWPMIAILAVAQTVAAVGGTDASVPLFALTVLVDIVIGLLWCRFFLLGGLNHNWWNVAGFQRAKEALKTHPQLIKKYAGWSIVLQIAVVLPTIIILAIFFAIFGDFNVTALFLAAALLAQFAVVRYLTFFPAVAIGRTETRMNEAYELSQNHTFKMWAAISLVTAPAMYLMLAIGAPLDERDVSLPRALDLTVVSVSTAFSTLTLISSVLGASAIAEIYRRLSGFDAKASKTP